MIDNDQITALAREYAEESTKADASDPNLSESDLIEIRHDIEEYVTGILRFLFRRFCLVEKENIEKYFQSRNYILTNQDKYEVYIVRESEVEMKLLRCLFPEIAKEVER